MSATGHSFPFYDPHNPEPWHSPHSGPPYPAPHAEIRPAPSPSTPDGTMWAASDDESWSEGSAHPPPGAPQCEPGPDSVRLYPTFSSSLAAYMAAPDARRYLKEAVRAGARTFRGLGDGTWVAGRYALEADRYELILRDEPHFLPGEEQPPAFHEAFRHATGWQHVQVPRFSYTSSEYALPGDARWVLITPATNQVFSLGSFMAKMTDALVDSLDAWADDARVHALPTELVTHTASGAVRAHHLAEEGAGETCWPGEGDTTLEETQCAAVHMVLTVASVVLNVAAPFGILTNGWRHIAISGLAPYRAVSISRSWGREEGGMRLPMMASYTPDTLFDTLAKILCERAFPAPEVAPPAPLVSSAPVRRPAVASKMPRSYAPTPPNSASTTTPTEYQ
ncbi:hypothetical protein Q8F55_001465 [Vanrija albida]|uniref:DUF317 domain-containing protein n=1 Tax=Vanrija albida TaxID=181172 RepID=A0ABR3QH37_9TREE